MSKIFRSRILKTWPLDRDLGLLLALVVYRYPNGIADQVPLVQLIPGVGKFF